MSGERGVSGPGVSGQGVSGQGTAHVADRLALALRITAGAVQDETLRPFTVPARSRRRWRLALAPAAAALAVALIVGTEAGLGPLGPAAPARAGHAAPTVSVGKNPAAVVLGAAAKTLYVLGARPDPVLTMVGTGACNAATTSGCGHVRRTASGGPYARDIAVDSRTRTLYVLGGRQADTVAVFDTATCNAATVSGCRARGFAHVPPGAFKLAVNPRNGSVYVTYNDVGQLSVIDGRSCNAASPGRCAAAVATAGAPALATRFPEVTVDPVTDTLYYGTASGLAVIDGRTCYIRDMLGCGTAVATIRTGAGGGDPASLIDQATGTLYLLRPDVAAVAVVNRNTCDALVTTGCAGQPPVIRGGPIPVDGVAGPAGTVYLTGGNGSSVYLVDASACRAGSLAACPAAPASFPVGAAPVQLVLDPATRTLYVTNTWSGTLSIINTATCRVGEQAGCPRSSPAGTRQFAPAAHGNPTYWCDGSATTYDSGRPAGPLITGSVRVAAGTVAGVPWSLWARRGIRDPFGIEQGGVVVGGRWYGLCEIQLSEGAAGNFEVIDAGAHAIVYGWAQHPQDVRFALTTAPPGRLPPPPAAHLNGLTFFITQLPKPACAYRSITLHAVATGGPAWGGVANWVPGGCLPGRLVPMGNGGGAGEWGRGVDPWANVSA